MYQGHDTDDMELDDTCHVPASGRKLSANTSNTKLTGRKRFCADVEAMKRLCSRGFVVNGLNARSFKTGEDEGNVEFEILNSKRHIVTLDLLVSDSSDYPKRHEYYGFSPDAEVDPLILDVIQTIPSLGSRTIQEVIRCIMTSISRSMDSGRFKTVQYVDVDAVASDNESYGDDDFDYDDDGDFQFGVAGDAKAATAQMSSLQRDFVDIVAADYRPGITYFGPTEFALSVSVPVLKLRIPPRALMAWDSRLLSSNQNLVLVISGLRGIYPPLRGDCTPVDVQMKLQFNVGLSPRYKPRKGAIGDVIRTFSLRDETETPQMQTEYMDADFDGASPHFAKDDDGFERFSLSTSLNRLLDQNLMDIIRLRVMFGIGWAGAELLRRQIELMQKSPGAVYMKVAGEVSKADEEEAFLEETYALPPDPLHEKRPEHFNLPLVAFCYVLRRLTLCSKFCLVCHNKIESEFEALKPYVCDSKLCTFQYYTLNLGPSIEYEIINHPQTVDLHLSLTYAAAAAQALQKEQLPVDLALRVRPPTATPNPPRHSNYILGLPSMNAEPPVTNAMLVIGEDGLLDFASLDVMQMQQVIVTLINSLPSVDDMKAYLERKKEPGKAKSKLTDMNHKILPAAWSILRWCVASATAYLEELTSDEDMLVNVGPEWTQFRFSVGAPDAEAKFKTAVTQAQREDANARAYPSIYAFHGSPLKNWHSIIRQGLLLKDAAHGRAYGHGVYFARDATVSIGYTVRQSASSWKRSKTDPLSCVAVAELVNLPKKFVSNSPFFVVADTHWIICRYLLVKSSNSFIESKEASSDTEVRDIPYVTLDPAYPLRFKTKPIQVPEPSYKLDRLLEASKAESLDYQHDDEDLKIFSWGRAEVIDLTNDSMSVENVRSENCEDWTHDPSWVEQCTTHIMPAPTDSTPVATMTLQRELKAMLREQDAAKSLRELGWYMPPDVIGDNLFQWIVELHSFEEDLPVAKDMKERGVNSLVFEIRFPPTFPHSPPFFRIIKPRFLPFIRGGGGHITGGGSMCMDLLTSDGWLPSYSISAILLQIKLAISNLDPRPARLAKNWDAAYSVSEALEGYKRAAAAHGWTIPSGLDRLVRS